MQASFNCQARRDNHVFMLQRAMAVVAQGTAEVVLLLHLLSVHLHVPRLHWLEEGHAGVGNPPSPRLARGDHRLCHHDPRQQPPRNHTQAPKPHGTFQNAHDMLGFSGSVEPQASRSPFQDALSSLVSPHNLLACLRATCMTYFLSACAKVISIPIDVVGPYCGPFVEEATVRNLQSLNCCGQQFDCQHFGHLTGHLHSTCFGLKHNPSTPQQRLLPNEPC